VCQDVDLKAKAVVVALPKPILDEGYQHMKNQILIFDI